MTTEDAQKKAKKKAYDMARRAANQEKIRAKKAAYYAANREKIRATKAAYHKANAKKLRAYQAAYRAANPEKVRILKAVYHKANAEKIRARGAAYRAANHEKVRSVQAAYYRANRERLREYNARYRESNREKLKARESAYRAANRKTISAKSSRYTLSRLKVDPLFRAINSLRCRMRAAFKCRGADKTQSTLNLVGCTKKELRQHLVSQFREGMTLENHGKVWHIDHIRPCASFDLSDPEQATLCFHYSNLQPLFVDENLRKSDRWVPTELRPLAA